MDGFIICFNSSIGNGSWHFLEQRLRRTAESALFYVDFPVMPGPFRRGMAKALPGFQAVASVWSFRPQRQVLGRRLRSPGAERACVPQPLCCLAGRLRVRGGRARTSALRRRHRRGASWPGAAAVAAATAAVAFRGPGGGRRATLRRHVVHRGLLPALHPGRVLGDLLLVAQVPDLAAPEEETAVPQ